MVTRLRKVFVVGVFAAAPLALTIYLVIQLAGWFDSLFQPLLMRALPDYTSPIPGLGIIIGIFVILVIGLLAPSLIGKQVLMATEKIVDRVPLAKLIYSGTKQIFDSFSQSGISKFSRVVLVPFPLEKCLALGFVTQELEEKVVAGTKGRQLSVFIPTTPNPTSGYLIIYPEEEAIPVQISAEEALKLIISGGIVRTSFASLRAKK
jgi:uncharacterized membrane protein